MNDNQKKKSLTINFLTLITDLVEKKKLTKKAAADIIEELQQSLVETDFADSIKDKMNNLLHSKKLYSEVDYKHK